MLQLPRLREKRAMGLQHHSHHRHALSRRGAALWEIMFAAAVIIITGFFIIPEFIWYYHPAYENAAVATLRMLTSAQEVYAAKWGVYGTPAQLGPDGQNLIDEILAGMTKNASIEKSGYYFRLDCAKDGSSWCAVAWPTKWGTTGDKAFHISADGTIKWKGVEGTNPDWNRANYPPYLGQ